MKCSRVTGCIVAYFWEVSLINFEDKVLRETSVVTFVTTQFHRLSRFVKDCAIGHWRRFFYGKKEALCSQTREFRHEFQILL